MDKDTLIGFLLIGVVLFAFDWFNRPTPRWLEAQRRYQDSIAKIEYTQQLELRKQENKGALVEDSLENLPDSIQTQCLQQSFGIFGDTVVDTEDYTILQSDAVELRINNKGGRICYARLKECDTYNNEPFVLFDEKKSDFNFTLVTATNRAVNTSDLYSTPVKENDPNSVIMRLNTGENSHLGFTYTLRPDDYMMQYQIPGTGLNGVLAPSTDALGLLWKQDIRQQEKGRKFEDHYVTLSCKFMADDVEHLSESRSNGKQTLNRLKWVGYKDMFFSTVLISQEGFEATTLGSKVIPERNVLKQFKATTSIPFDLQGKEATNLSFYFGPNKFALLKSFDKGVSAKQQLDLERLVPLGWSIFRWVNQCFMIPLLDFLDKFIHNYGILILLIIIIMKIILFLLTYKSYVSSAGMHVLHPQAEEINTKYPGQDKAMGRQKATMELYSRAGAGPMSGCLPMLLQVPILIALFMFFPSVIELRHQGSLWVHDLSTYDVIFSWNKYIPIIIPYFGDHISLFCLLMTVTNISYIKYSMEMTNTRQQQMPGMKAMMYMMPLMFLVLFNQYASDLTYYYFVSTLITVVQTLTFRYTISEDKLLAKLEVNKWKPMKKSGFMKRLKEAQRIQQETLRRQQEAKKERQDDGNCYP